jgi:hypothetical protein
VVLLYDGLRVVRYAEPEAGGHSRAAVDFARTDGADAATATALVVSRTQHAVRYLTAPWVTSARLRDLLRPHTPAGTLHRRNDGVTAPVSTPPSTSACSRWSSLELRTDPAAGAGRDPHLLTDLGELTPVLLTYGRPDGPRGAVVGSAGRASWARTACVLPAVRSLGVRAVNSWEFARQPLPGGGSAAWVCTRAETWRGPGSTVMAQFQPPGRGARAPAAVAARAHNTSACGRRSPRVLAGVMWKSRGGRWYVLAAGSREVSSITASGGAQGRAPGNVLALPAAEGAVAELDARLRDGGRITALR